MNDEWLSAGPTARELGVSTEQVRQWAISGRLPSIMTPLGRLFRRFDVEALKSKRETAKTREAAGAVATEA